MPGQTCYYKIDLVRLNEESGMTEYYDILRNYDFHINVTGVSAPEHLPLRRQSPA